MIGRTQLTSFGGWTIRRSGDTSVRVPTVRQRRLLCWLVLGPWGPPLDIATLCDSLWPSADGDTARNNFSSAIRRMRPLLGGPAALKIVGGTIALNDRVCRTDLDLLRWLSAQAGRRCDAARARRLGVWLLKRCQGFNPVLLGAADSQEMAVRQRSLGAAWQQVVWRIAERLQPEDAWLALELCLCLDRHGLADERILQLWDRAAARGIDSRG
ncbi:hypothetical protein GN316_15675 [Xylophilus sp. Kf1]|nr:hypothetical protein [Xylophilus sp. Kf1]